MSLDEEMDNRTSAWASNEENTSSRNLNNYGDKEVKTQVNVAAKGTEVNGHEEDNNNVWLQATKIVKGWESAHHRSLRRTSKDIALKTAYIQLTQKRGIVRPDLQKWYNYDSNYARRKMYLLQKELGLLVPLRGRRRIGRFQQYCISTELDKFNEDQNIDRDIDNSSVEGGGQAPRMTLIQHLVATLSRRKPTFHKLYLYTELPSELYDDLNWAVPSARNKAKVKEFPIEHRRSVRFEIYPEGTAGIYMVSTANAYELHTPKGLVDFFSSLGEARSILKSECSDLRRIPPVNSWKLKMFDKDKTILVSELERDIPQVMRLWSDEGIRIEHLGEVFQIYGKVMPETGTAFRFEAQSTVDNPEEEQLTEALIKETFPEIKFKTAFDMINDLKKRVEQLESNDNRSIP
jgi:hypothetical protein